MPQIPDLATSVASGVNADASTIAQRRIIDTAARLGLIVWDGRIYTPEAFQARYDSDLAAMEQARASGDTNALRYYENSHRGIQDFRGLSDADVAQQDLLSQIQGAGQTTAAYLDLQRQYGTQFAEEARNQLRASDPTGFALREQMGERLANGTDSIESLLRNGPAAPTYEQFSDSRLPQYERLSQSDAPRFGRLADGSLPALSSLSAAARPELERLSAADRPGLERITAGDAPSFQTIGTGDLANLRTLDRSALANLGGVDGVRLADAGRASAGRAELEGQIFDELSQAGQPDPALRRAAEQAARARGAATGNILSDSNALQESLAVQLAQRDLDARRRGDALSLLSSGQTSSDTANRLRQQQLESDIASTGFNNDSSQRGFDNERVLNAQNNDTEQARFANRTAAAGFNNAAGQQRYANTLSRAGFNNEAGQQDFRNVADLAAFNNAAGQQDFRNVADITGFNNEAAQQGFANRATQTGFNNDAAQTEFANRGNVAQFNNSVADNSFNAAMAAINQRNQATQNTFGAQQGQLDRRLQARQQDLSNAQSFLGLQPVASQAGALANMQQGSAPFNPGNLQGALTNPAAGQMGAEWAGQLYGAQTQLAAAQSQASAARTAGNRSLIGAGIGAAGAIGGAAIIAI